MLAGTLRGTGGALAVLGLLAVLIGAGLFFSGLTDEQANQGQERGLFRDGPDEARSHMNGDLAQAGMMLGAGGAVGLAFGMLMLGLGGSAARHERRGRTD